MDPEDTGNMLQDVARRLRRLRKRVHRVEQEEFAQPLGVSQSGYSNFDSGKRPLTLRVALKLCEHYDLSLDWLYRGDPSNLPGLLRRQLKAARKLDQAGAPDDAELVLEKDLGL